MTTIIKSDIFFTADLTYAANVLIADQTDVLLHSVLEAAGWLGE